MSIRKAVPGERSGRLTPTFTAAALAGLLSAGASAATCESLSSVAMPFVTVTTAATVTGGTFTPPGGAAQTGLPDFCRVALTIAPTPDSNIAAEVWMPAATWNGRFQGTGGGGYTGALNYAALAGPLRLGYAVTNTDMGTAPATVLNGVPIAGHPEKYLDFGARSTHMMTVAAKTLVQAYYGREPDYSYFVGCSTGGHQGFEEAQVFPDDYDGILAGAPGHNRTHLHETFVSNWVRSHTAPGAVIPAAKLTLLNNAVIQACRGRDGGLPGDNFLSDPRECNFDPAVLQCTGSDTSTCLTASELVTARQLYDGLRNPRTQELIYPGWPLGSETGWGLLEAGATEAFPGILNWVLGANYNPLSLNFDTDVATVDATLAPAVNFMSTDLSRFYGHGGKLLVYHGYADPIVAPQDSINYFDRIGAEQGLTDAQRQSFARLFLVPGMGHCSGGAGPNTFDAFPSLVDWVEKGTAPESIVGAGTNAGVPFTRPLCSYPREARYAGTGDPNAAANWVCADDGNNEASKVPAANYLAPLIIQARAVPEAINLRVPAGLVTVVLTTPPGSADFNQWIPGNIRAEGASPVTASRSADGRTYVVTFNRRDLVSFTGGRSAGKSVDLMLTGSLQHDGVQSLFATSATVRLFR